ncbi:MAG TPA: hypothetical protein VFR23_09570, partial [Jiangellaceae bacterium]|nr:hypothetical protein [Jiangellaceae bacterium]
MGVPSRAGGPTPTPDQIAWASDLAREVRPPHATSPSAHPQVLIIATANLGDVVLVNGTYGPFLDVTTETLRLRVLNASAARVYNFGLSDDREFSVVGSDGCLLPEPVTARRLVVSPDPRAERTEP